MAKRFDDARAFEIFLIAIVVAAAICGMAWIFSLVGCAASAAPSEGSQTPSQPSGEWFCNVVGCAVPKPHAPHKDPPRDASRDARDVMPATMAYALELQACLLLERTRADALRCRAQVVCKWTPESCPDGAPP